MFTYFSSRLFIPIRRCYSLGTDVGGVIAELGTEKGDNVKEIRCAQAQYLRNKG